MNLLLPWVHVKHFQEGMSAGKQGGACDLLLLPKEPKRALERKQKHGLHKDLCRGHSSGPYGAIWGVCVRHVQGTLISCRFFLVDYISSLIPVQYGMPTWHYLLPGTSGPHPQLTLSPYAPLQEVSRWLGWWGERVRAGSELCLVGHHLCSLPKETCNSLIRRSEGGNISDGMNTKFFPFQSQGGKVIQTASADGHHVVTRLFFVVWRTGRIASINTYQDLTRCPSCVYLSGYIKIICVS